MELAHFWGILFISLHAMVPITLAAIGETIEESAGLFNIGLEGILLLGALAGALGAQASGSAVIGLMTGIGKPVDHWRRNQSFCAGVCSVDAERDGRARFS